MSEADGVGFPRKLYNFVAFQAGWFACVFSGAAGRGILGVAVVTLLLAIHLRIARTRPSEWKLLAASVPIGLAVNTTLQTTGAIVVVDAPPTGPLWLLALWPLFATLLRESMRWMRGRIGVGVVFGVVGAPLSYLAGERAGALELHDETGVWIAAVAVTWGLAMAALLAVDARLAPIRASTPAPHRSSS